MSKKRKWKRQRKNARQYNEIKAGLWYTIGNMLIKGIPFLTLPIFTRLLSTADFGIYNTYISYESVLGIILGFGISGTIKIAKVDFKDNFEQYISSILRFLLLVGGVSLVIANFIGFLWVPENSWLNPLILNVLVLQSISTAIYGVMSCKFVIEGDYIRNLSMAFIMTGINIGSSLLLCYIFMSSNRAETRILGTCIGAVVTAICILVSQSRKAGLIRNPEANRYALKLGIPLIPHQLSISLLSQCDKIMIQAMVGNSQAGIYGLAVNITMVISVVLSSIDNAWTPNFYRLLAGEKYRELKEKNNFLVMLFMFLTCGSLLIGPDIIHIMAEQEYWDSVYALIPLTISVFINFMYIFSVGVEYFCKKTGYISLTTLVCTAVNIILNYFFIIHFGYIAAAYATCLSKLFLFVLHHVRAKKLLQEDIVSFKCLNINLFFVCLTGVLTIVYINNILVRYLLIGGGVALMVSFFKIRKIC